MKFKTFKLAPVIIGGTVILMTCLTRLVQFDYLEYLEWNTYDLRVKAALHFPPPAATNLAVVFITDDSIKLLDNGTLGFPYGLYWFRYGLYWPRHVYGRVLREAHREGARIVGFDVIFAEPREDHAPVRVSVAKWPDAIDFINSLHPGKSPTQYRDGGEVLALMESDDYFAWQLNRTGLAALAADRGVKPIPLFATNATALGDISADPDLDGVLRRARAFRCYTNWHYAFRQVEADPGYGIDLSKAQIFPDRIILPRNGGLDPVEIPVDAENRFELADFGGEKLPPGVPAKAPAFTVQRVWHMGIVLAARELGLDLDRAEVDLPAGRIVFRSATGVERILPVDQNGYFMINWELPLTDPRLTVEPIEKLIAYDLARNAGHGENIEDSLKDKVVVIGSSATGNDLTDRGATPLDKHALLVSKHWNVANSIITGNFVTRPSLTTELCLIAILGALSAVMSWRLRAYSAVGGVLCLALAYGGFCVWIYVNQRLWLPMVLPVIGAMLGEYGALVTYRVVFVERERRRVKSIFSKIVAPDVMNVLLDATSLSLGGARREVTVLFADVRGFTELTDQSQERVTEYVREQKLAGDEAEAWVDEAARETLSTVNLYLSTVTDKVLKHNGTFDKYIGDCVMAFWGAPAPNPRHALDCVRAAMDAQKAIHEINRQRRQQNQQLEQENRVRASNGLPPKPLLVELALGTGINTGTVTVGLMGSEEHQFNYTVFGREVNLASRLETVSGRSRIVISEATYQHLKKEDPALAATCVELPPASVKGFRAVIKNFEVPWRAPDEVAPATGIDVTAMAK